MRKKIFTFLLALAASVGLSWATTVTWNNDDITGSWGTSFTKDGVTITAGFIDFEDKNFMDGGTFTTTLGNFTKIEVSGGSCGASGTGWSGDYAKKTWTGNASSVSFSGDFMGMGMGKTKFVFTIGDPDPTYTVALKDGTANADKVTLSATSAVEGATITVTPDDEYEITAFSAKYNTTEEAPSTLDLGTGAYSFTMPAYDVTIEATIALKPVPEGDIFAGFTATAGSGGFDNEGSANLVDNKFISSDWTKWCTNDGHKSVPTGESESCWWIDFEASAALNLTGYILTTGNDTGNEHGRNPKNWVLKAKLNADDAWTTIATVTDDVTMKNKSFKDYKFFVDQSGTYQYFRFEVFANQGSGVMQLCELRLIGAEPVLVTSHTLQLHVNDAAMGSLALQNPSNDIVDNGDGTYTVPEGATVTLLATPNEGYEFTGWKASSSICDFNECEFDALPTVDNPLTVDMYMTAAFMAEFAAVAPQPQTAVEIGDSNDATAIEAFLTNNDGQTIDELIIDRPVLNNMYNTLCLPFDMNAAQIAASSLNGVEIREFTGASVEGTTLNLSVGDPVNAVVAGRPYFVKYSAASQLDDLHFEDVTINNALLDNMAVTFDGVTFKGTFTPFVMPNGLNFQGGYLFLGQNNQLFWPNTSNPLKPFRAYFYVDVESSTPGNAPKYRGMPARIVEGKNVATGVESIQQSAVSSQKFIENGQLIIIKNDVRYNAQGQIVK